MSTLGTRSVSFVSTLTEIVFTLTLGDIKRAWQAQREGQLASLTCPISQGLRRVLPKAERIATAHNYASIDNIEFMFDDDISNRVIDRFDNGKSVPLGIEVRLVRR